MNEDTIREGDVVRLANGRLVTVGAFDNARGLYWTSVGLRYRYEFQPVKWDGDVIGETGIGVCAQGAAGQ